MNKFHFRKGMADSSFASAADEAGPIDEAFECDAPRFYDFSREPATPGSPASAEAWFRASLALAVG